MAILVFVASIFIVFAAIQYLEIIKYKRQINDKNLKLVQLYEDTKFFCKSLHSSLITTENSTFCIELTKKIKEYYNLQDVLIITSSSILKQGNNNTIKKYIIENIDQIKESLLGHQMQQIHAFIKGKNYVLYITKSTQIDSLNSLIVCIESVPVGLNAKAKQGLESALNLLKSRITYTCN